MTRKEVESFLQYRSLAAWLAAACLLALGGCLSVPVSTLYKLSQLSKDDLINLDATQIRAAIEVPDNVAVDSSKITIGIKVTSPDAKEANANNGVWPVQMIGSGRYVPLVIPPSEAGRKQYLYKLTPEAESRLATVLADIKAHPDPGTSVQIAINFDGAFLPPPGLKSFKASAWLQLRSADGPLLLIDDRTIDAADLK